MLAPYISNRRIGLALSGGSVRGIAHIGVIKVLAEYGIQPQIVVGTSVGSLVGAGIAAGMTWRELKKMAESVFWPALLQGRKLEQFCSYHLPSSFADLSLPFAAIATTLPSRRTVVLKTGNLGTAISASCAMRVIRRPVSLNGEKLKDGGISCVLPSLECHKLGAEFIIGSDVWEYSAFLRGLGISYNHRRAHLIYPHHYIEAVHRSDLLIQPDIPIKVYMPGCITVDQLITAGETATLKSLKSMALTPGAA